PQPHAVRRCRHRPLVEARRARQRRPRPTRRRPLARPHDRRRPTGAVMEANPLTGKALRSLDHTARITAYEGSVRSGKTFTTLIDWVRYCRTGPPGRLLMGGRTERTIINNLI